jgi:hypothetical protein
MAIAGPKIQVPTPKTRFIDDVGNIVPQWQSLFHSLQQTAWIVTRSGPTASRPTSSVDGRWIGMPYFDTDLGYEINLQSINPDVWVKWDGTAV